MLRFNTGFSRRELLQVGSLSALGVNLLDTVQQPAVAAQPRREVNCILLWLLGGPSHIDMYDMKPLAPPEIRGELNPIATRVPGLELSELMPHMADCAEKFSVIRSMHSYSPTHGQGDFHLMSGNRLTNSLNPPGFGAMLTWQQERRARQTPPFVQVGKLASPRYGDPGFGGFLGRTYDPFVVERDPNSGSFAVDEFSPPESVGVDRLSDRQSLLAALDQFQSHKERQLQFARTHEVFREQALSMITSRRAKDAFDISQESEKVRDNYGRNRVGQGLLLARRLVEAGVRFVTVKGYVRYGWDHHPEVFPRLRTEVPPYQQGYAALLNDLDQRGMLDNTLVITAGEFGRTPRLNNDPRAPGRDHWNRCFSLTLGGGGIKKGIVLGASDKHAAEIADRPVSVPDFAATVYHALGLNPKAELRTLDDRPTLALPKGEVIPELI
ncbi:MAG: DUF1501 domain-containing protein [Planctomycetaceae bacterium]|jgi:hypothetical protein|nr:DUF1501 domain-containing protein [Planctomycetaceae bacterium]MBT6154482.1 DUF1501 domain-containing protein [Planctomycetaceae bacterium]MBT6486512.1 DUF1501 domain-containing protein [Planctomycetaceae bacterium]MBT6497939.1 DUF1501 domain-containing protein [Planctomycetaceae bacterium]